MVEDSLETFGTIGIIGTGAVGTTLARALDARGAHVAAVAARNRSSADALAAQLSGTRSVPLDEMPTAADLILLAVSDGAISPLAETLPWRVGQGVAHLSGAHGADALDAVRARGAHPAALHPLMTLARPSPDVPADSLLRRLDGCVWALEASDAALASMLEALVTMLGGSIIHLAPEHRVPYHISGVLASNYIVTLLSAAVRLWQPFAGPEEALRALLPLLRGASENLDGVGLPNALSGPIARGDVATVAAHLSWLDTQIARMPGTEAALLRDAYVALAELTIPVALAKGTLTPTAANALRALWRRDTPGGAK